jgi:hypothetical protein
VAPNPDPVVRNGNLAIGGVVVQVTQASAPCVIVLSGNSRAIGSEAATVVVQLSTHATCSWTASTDVPWARVTPGSGRGRPRCAWRSTPMLVLPEPAV